MNQLFNNPTHTSPHDIDPNGKHRIYVFENGYGASVVKFKMMNGRYGSYTDNENEWELAVLKDKKLCYDSGITDDVIGHLTENQVEDYLIKIKKL